MVTNLKRRVEALEAKIVGDKVTLEELILWSTQERPFNAETQRRYDDFERRFENSRLCRLMREAVRPGMGTETVSDAPEPEQPSETNVGPANSISLDDLVAQSYRDHPPPPMEKPRSGDAPPQPGSPARIKAEPGLSLDALLLRDRPSPPARVEPSPSRAGFDSWVRENMLWPESRR
jgi:hypothetical protein